MYYARNMKFIRKLDRFVIHLENIISAVTLLMMCVVVFISVVLRYFNVSFPAADEIARYFMIWSVYIGIIVVTRHKAHVNVEIFSNILSTKTAQKALDIFIQIVTILTFIWLLYLSFGLVGRATGPLAQKSPITKTPYWFMYSSLTIGFTMSIVRQLQVFYRTLTNKEEIEGGVE